MFIIPITDQPNANDANGKEREDAKATLLSALSRVRRSFWSYTEETGETDTKPFEGIL